MPWATSYNPTGVRNYDSPLEGIAATLATFGRDKLTNEYYTSLWSDLQTGKYTAEQLVERNREGIRKWGTNPDLMLKVLKEI